ncbi:G-type lectin S-receptor-like serine/threonine-protein kinase LECRK2 [Typha angustifolia]|uniref:G-type lectin S-receptor-like serine/threonine-protein kinase LECRK2 n=1 Tax=Typha angustifolia TaxID=59011 RepID=UPI003C2EAD26
MILFLLPFLLPLAATSQTYANLTVGGSTLSPVGPNAAFSSPSGDFAFGFYPLPNSSLFLLAVFFNATSPTTIVWFATNSAGPVQVAAKSTLLLTGAGQLSLTDPTGTESWNPGPTGATHVSLLDSGNMVVFDADDTPLWQSFSSATDTLLPGQSLTAGAFLRSKLTDLDISLGRYALVAQTDGNLVMYPIMLPTGNYYHAYWASNTVGSGTKLVFDSSGSIYYVLKNINNTNTQTSEFLILNTTYSTRKFHQRATLDPDGAFRLYIYPKNPNNGSWESKWSAESSLPTDPCEGVRSDYGGGLCGLNAYCRSNAGVQPQLNCECPPRYTFLDSERKYLGCKPEFPAQQCDVDQSSEFELVEMVNTYWPNGDYDHYKPIEENTCRQYCLDDCYCTVAFFKDGDCWKKRLPLTSGWQGSNIEGKAFIKVVKSNSSLLKQRQPNSATIAVKKDHSSVLVIASLLGSSGFLNLVFLVTIVALALAFCNTKESKNKLQHDPRMSEVNNLRAFTYKELEDATNGFKDELGSGAFGTVYKGILLAYNSKSQTPIAVKRLDRLLKDTEKEFTNEVRSIGQTHHRNLVKLLGFCNEGTHRMLVYEYMSNGSLTEFLRTSPRPSWSLRVKIAIGIAKGLLYLHEECCAQIIHCDIKPGNILLDDDFVPRISDFGLAKLLRPDQTRTNTGIRGTRGYVAAEWFRNSAITAKVDVYSFGVMLLELVCCRKNLEQDAEDEAATVLTFWAYDCMRGGRMEVLVEGDEEAAAEMRTVERFVMVAFWCIHEEPSLRPAMNNVVQMLEGVVDVSVPPDPYPL